MDETFLLSSKILKYELNHCFVAEGEQFTSKKNSVPGIEPSNRVYSQIPLTQVYFIFLGVNLRR